MKISRRGSILLLSVVVASSVACSSHEQHPSQIGDCMGFANACINGQVGSGSGSSVDGGSPSDADTNDADTDDAGTNDTGTNPGQSCGRFVYQSVACETCVEGACCDQAEMCSSDPDCFPYVQCVGMCKSTDTQCITDCQTSNPLGFTNSTHLEQCVKEKCSTQCQ